MQVKYSKALSIPFSCTEGATGRPTPILHMEQCRVVMNGKFSSTAKTVFHSLADTCIKICSHTYLQITVSDYLFRSVI